MAFSPPYPAECNGYRAIDYDRVLRLAYDKIMTEYPNQDEVPELTKTLARQRVDRILVGKRQIDGSQEVQVLLNDPKKQKRRFALSLFGELQILLQGLCTDLTALKW